MLSTGATILVVDQKPDMVSLTQLVMRSFLVNQQPVRTVTAPSAADGATLLQTSLATRQGASLATVALIALDLETPRAGLGLCRFIREELHNREIQLYLRVEAPDAVPERAAFDRYLIAGYYTSAEIATDRLYSLVKIGVHYYRSLVRARILMGMLEALVAARTKARMAQVFNHFIIALEQDANGKTHGRADARVAMFFDGQIVASHPAFSDDSLYARWQSLRQQSGITLSDNGDAYIIDDENLLIHIEPGPTQAAFDYLCFLTGETPDSFVADFYRFARVAATLWQYAP